MGRGGVRTTERQGWRQGTGRLAKAAVNTPACVPLCRLPMGTEAWGALERAGGEYWGCGEGEKGLPS